MAELNYQVGTEVLESREPIPAGEYEAIITESDVKGFDLNESTGNYLGEAVHLTFQIINHPVYADRKIFTRIHLNHANAQHDEKKLKMVEIARRTLNMISQSVGIDRISHTEELHNRPLNIKVAVRPSSTDAQTGKQYEAQNEIKMYFKHNSKNSVAQPPIGPPQGVACNPTQQPPNGQYSPPQGQPVAAPWSNK